MLLVNVLFMCVANSARSQMAEGLAKEILRDAVWVESAGSEPKTVNPYAIQVMREIGIDISKHHSKSYEQLSPKFIMNLNYVITLCAEEVCPTMIAPKAKKLHWPFPDPAVKAGNELERLQKFRETRDQIKSRLEKFVAEVQSRSRDKEEK